MVDGAVRRVTPPTDSPDAAIRFHGDGPGLPDRANRDPAVAGLKRRRVAPALSDNPHRDRCGNAVEHPGGLRDALANRASPC